jgi:type II secretory pathway pseudopilin PulG
MSRRSGVTLVEVLVSIFVMGIGLIALLTLFPIGILRMGKALNEERAHQAARNADAVAVFQNIRNDVGAVLPGGVVNAINDPYNKNQTNSDLFANPAPFRNLPPFPALLPTADPYGESYPIFVDPIGYYSVAAGSLAQDWVAGSRGVLRRRPVSFALNPNNNVISKRGLYLNFSLWDDMVWDTSTVPGSPQVTGVSVMRDTRYSWAYTLRRPMTSDKSVVDCAIVVYDGRSLSTTGTGTLSEQVYSNTAYFNPANRTITIDWTATGVGPPVRPGDWLFDVTFSGTATIGGAHAYWYRVVAAEDLVVAGKSLTRFEVQQPIRGFVAPSGTAPALLQPPPNTLPFNHADVTAAGAVAPTVYQGTVVFLDGVAEVYEKGPSRLP